MTGTISLPDRFAIVRNPELRRLVRYYRSVSSDGRTISRDALDPLHLRTMLARVFYFDYDATADDFRLRLAGEEIRAVLPNAKRGATLAEIVPAGSVDDVRGYFRHALRERLVLHALGPVVFSSGQAGIGERIVVPVGDAAGRPAQLFGATCCEAEANNRAAPPAELDVTFLALCDDANDGEAAT